MEQMNKAFERWFAVSKYTQVIYPNIQTHQIALDGYQAASQHYEAKIAEIQAELDKARELLTEAREIVYMYNDEYQEEDAKNTLICIDAFLAKDK